MTTFSKAVKLIATTSIAATSLVAINPFQAEAATSAESLVVKAESNIVLIKRAISADYNADAVTQPWTEYNKAKTDYNAAKAAVSKLSGTQKTKLSARLDTVKLWIDRTAVYIDSISSGKKLLTAQATMEKHLQAGNMVEATKAYHALSYEIKKQAAYLYKVYGQSTRQAILAEYKLPAEAAKAKAIYPVSIHLEIGKLALAIEKEDNVAVNKSFELIGKWFDFIEDENVFNALYDQLVEVVDTYAPTIDEVAFYDTEIYANEYIDAFGLISFTDNNGVELYIDPTKYGLIIKDNKGFFNEDGTLTAAYEEADLPLGEVTIQLVDEVTGEVIIEHTFNVVAG